VRAESVIGLAPMDTAGNTIRGIRLAYVAVFVLVQWLPLDLNVSLTAMHAKLLPGADGSPPRTILDPLYHLTSSAGERHRLILTLLGFVPIGVFARVVRPATSVSHTVLVAGALAALTQGGSIFVQSARSDVIVLPLSMTATALGWWLAGIGRLASEPRLTSPRQQALTSWVLWVLTCFAICVVWWSPYIFELDPDQALVKLRAFNWIPFRLHSGVREFVMFIPFGFLGARAYGPHTASNVTRLVTVVLGALLFGSFLEFSQIVVADRYPDVTDVVLAGAGAMLGALLALCAGQGS
jgi:glycopeptide antibiotics resistance protein